MIVERDKERAFELYQESIKDHYYDALHILQGVPDPMVVKLLSRGDPLSMKFKELKKKDLIDNDSELSMPGQPKGTRMVEMPPPQLHHYPTDLIKKIRPDLIDPETGKLRKPKKNPSPPPPEDDEDED